MTITERLKGRPVYQGFVIPYSILVVNGIPDFKTSDSERWLECATKRLCAICGARLDYWAWYIGSDTAADAGLFIDLGMHEECAFYSASVCPFIACGKEYAQNVRVPEGYVYLAAPAKRPAKMVASRRRRDQLTILANGPGFMVQVGPELERIELEVKA